MARKSMSGIHDYLAIVSTTPDGSGDSEGSDDSGNSDCLFHIFIGVGCDIPDH